MNGEHDEARLRGAPMEPMTLNWGTLTLLSIEDGYNIHTDPDGNEVYVQHRTCRLLVPFDEIDVAAEWAEHKRAGGRFKDGFLRRLKDMTFEPDEVDDQVGWCSDCASPEYDDDLSATNGSRRVCESCSGNYYGCEHCEERFRETTTTLHEDEVCESCRGQHYSYCESCEGYYHHENGGEHSHDRSTCESPAQEFWIRNDGQEPLPNDTRVTITLPVGLDEQTVEDIRNTIRNFAYEEGVAGRFNNSERQKWAAMANDLAPLGVVWQAKGGNYTRRLSSHAYKNHGIKLPAELISRVGNVAASRSKTPTIFDIEVTRDLNLSAEDFCHEESCWWQGYYPSRCTLKSNGGFGLRTFGQWGVQGRAWVMPLRRVPVDAPVETTITQRREMAGLCVQPNCCEQNDPGGPTVAAVPLTPTFETENPDAFIVFNGYGDLEGYVPARVMAHMAGMTYRKIEFTGIGMYVNGNAGYLVAPEDIAADYTDKHLYLALDQHATLYADESAAQSSTISEELVHA